MSFGIRYKRATEEDHTSINGERYVYYQRLLTDKITFGSGLTSARLYEKANDVLTWRITEGSNARKIAEYFFSLRNGEYKKEVALLKTKFGQTIGGKYDSPNSDNHNIGRELIEAFNTTLNMKSIFERNLALIQQTEGQKQLISYFHTYFTHAWEAHSPLIVEKIRQSEYLLTSLEKAIEDAINFYLNEMVRDALIEMFRDAKTESGIKNGEKYQQAYAELLPALEDCTNQRGNDFINSFIKAYKLDELTQKLAEENINLQNIDAKVRSFNYGKKIKAQAGSLGGIASEILSVYVADIMHGIDSSYKGYHTGGTGQRADAMFTFDIPTQPIADWLAQNRFGHREENVKALKSLGKELETFDEGFIVYSNAKNWGLSTKFFKEKGGFSAGTPISLDTWDTLMHTARKKGRDLVFSALQLVQGADGKPGAIGEGRQEEISMMFARAISLALFDDFDTIGLAPRNGVKSIHLLYLNGIYFPLSFYYNLLGEAFNEYAINEETDISSLIKVDIDSPKMLYPTQKTQMEKAPNGGAWNIQSQNALKNTKVSYHFMRAYEKIMRDLFK